MNWSTKKEVSIITDTDEDFSSKKSYKMIINDHFLGCYYVFGK